MDCGPKLKSNGIHVSQVIGPVSRRAVAAPLMPKRGANRTMQPSKAVAAAIFTNESRRMRPMAISAQYAVTFKPSRAKLQAQRIRQVVVWAAKSAPIQRVRNARP